MRKNKKIPFFKDFCLLNGKNVVFLHPQNGGTVAQLVEQRTENPRVTGSIPVGTTKNVRDAKHCVSFLFHLSCM